MPEDRSIMLTFEGRQEVWFSVDPAEYRGQSRDEIAEQLSIQAHNIRWCDYDHDQFLEAADEVLAALEHE